ncbi:MAG: M15 family metallopeptidase [gamma proteobacterium symbiont of Lucinoma myriamae]|nr:M15 family metallopeptidase [gamma proteobacterium symbiont of Lucinoma myriamae]MCU7818970.1 M15 family metallopeptidase [gamma proteobacterium symbiont of Lucinoma myriamae]
MDLAAYKMHIEKTNRLLGIPKSYAKDYALSLHIEENDLVEIGKDIFDRTQFLASKAESQWYEMYESAKNDRIELHVVSAFRSVEYQANIIQRKLKKGLKLSDILRVSAAPGYSEHHSGCALDLTTTGIDALSENFDQTKAFGWLQQNGEKFGFSLSYPNNQERKIIYEPWHWSCL